MSGWALLCLGVAAAALGAALWQRRQSKQQLLRLQAMLEAAIRGDFQERSYDESLLSAVEARLAQYLSASRVSARNLTEEKETIKSLIADISHQTKTPLSNLLLYAQLLDEQPLPPESVPCVKALNAQAEKLSFLIEALVKVSRLESGVFALSPVLQPVQPLLEQVVRQAAPKADAKGVALHLEPADSAACFDRKWTAEALYNLVDNAVKYTPAGGSVQLSSSAYELFVSIDVRDTGAGIPEAEQEKIFARFYRGAAAQDAEGVGIGLYLTRQIAAEEGGYVKVRSRPGQGAVFSLFLPREASVP